MRSSAKIEGQNVIVEKIFKHPEFVEGVHWQEKKYLANEHIVHSGDTSQDLYYLKGGIARVIGKVTLDDNRNVNPGVCDLNAGEMFGELVLFDQQPRSASVVCVSDCDVIVIDGKLFLAFMETHKDIGFDVLKYFMNSLVKRLRDSNKKIFSLFSWGLKAHGIDEHLR